MPDKYCVLYQSDNDSVFSESFDCESASEALCLFRKIYDCWIENGSITILRVYRVHYTVEINLE